MLDIVDGGLFIGRVVDENLDRVGAPTGDAFGGNVRQQIGKPAGLRVVVAAQLISQQEPGVGTARVAGLQAAFRGQQAGAGVRGANVLPSRLEFALHVGGDLFVTFTGRRIP